jgi:adenosylcobyric acid synthase
MRPYAERVERQLERGDRGSNTACPYYPCHFKGQNCTHCFCPFYPCGDTRLGSLVPSRDGTPVWSCKDCFWIHRHDVAKTVCRLLAGKDMHHATDEELAACKEEAECRHAVRARALMVLGTMSGAGKSLMAAALCRIFSDEGYLVSPFKAQNMSLNACVTPDGEEIARIQELQARAARREPDGSMNPILLKPKRDDVSSGALRTPVPRHGRAHLLWRLRPFHGTRHRVGRRVLAHAPKRHRHHGGSGKPGRDKPRGRRHRKYGPG